MYLFRGQLSFFCMFAVVLLMPPLLFERRLMIALMLLLGMTSWMLHGTACMLTSMVSTSAISALQTGFRTPEIIAILACYLLSIGSSASLSSLHVFFVLIATLVMVGMVAWTLLVQMPYIQDVLSDKDAHESTNARAARAGEGHGAGQNAERVLGDDGDESSDDDPERPLFAAEVRGLSRRRAPRASPLSLFPLRRAARAALADGVVLAPSFSPGVDGARHRRNRGRGRAAQHRGRVQRQRRAVVRSGAAAADIVARLWRGEFGGRSDHRSRRLVRRRTRRRIGRRLGAGGMVLGAERCDNRRQRRWRTSAPAGRANGGNDAVARGAGSAPPQRKEPARLGLHGHQRGRLRVPATHACAARGANRRRGAGQRGALREPAGGVFCPGHAVRPRPRYSTGDRKEGVPVPCRTLLHDVRLNLHGGFLRVRGLDKRHRH